MVRHGITAWNRDRICQGQTDVPLSEEGREQAMALARRLEATHFDAAWCSDLSRAHETARIVLQGRALTLETSESLREMSFGEWEGQDLGDLFERFPEQRQSWHEEPAAWQPPGGERLGEVQARMCTLMDGLREAHPDGRVLVVGHGFAILVYVCHVIGLPIQHFRRLWVDPTSITELRFGGRVPILKRHNDHAHLE